VSADAMRWTVMRHYRASLAVVLLVASCGDKKASLPSGPATLTIAEHYVRDPHGVVAIEGALQFIDVSDGRAVVTRKLPVRLHLPPGRYTLRSVTRTCAGDCTNLDPPELPCRATVHAPARVQVVTHDNALCRIRVLR
jgi:hypothetical protein